MSSSGDLYTLEADTDAVEADDTSGDTAEDTGWEQADTDVPDDALAVIEIYALDLWAQALPADSEMVVFQDGEYIEPSGWPKVNLPITGPTLFEVEITADGYEPLQLVIDCNGTDGPTGVQVYELYGDPVGLSVSHDQREVDGKSLTVHGVFAGLRHKWFSAQGRPARRGNQIDLLTSGEEAWSIAADEIWMADDRINISTWWWESDFELVRDPWTHPYSTEAERQQNTILTLLDESYADKRVLVGQWLGQDGLLDWVTSDADLRDRGEQPGDGFEFMGQANPTSGVFWFELTPFWFSDRLLDQWTPAFDRNFDADNAVYSTIPGRVVDLTDWPVTAEVEAASYHQKFLTVDGEVAMVGGMNLRHVDWDTDEHLVFEPRRMNFDASMTDRLDVADKEQQTDSPPRKDYMMYMQGPIVQDVDQVFQERWDHQRWMGVDYSENTSSFELVTDLAPIPGGVQAQLTTTLPAPFNENSIAETWLNAIAQAEDYIYIEDQYFRIPMLTDAILTRMEQRPNLELIVITPEVSEVTDLGCVWTYLTAGDLKYAFPDRFHTFQLKSFDTQETWGIDETEGLFVDINLHSKMLMVDDKFMSVGSANKNNRGIVYEA